MSSKSILFLLFLVFLSMHACNGRRLGVSHKNSGRRAHHQTKDVKKAMILEDTSIPLMGKPSLAEKVVAVKKSGHDGANVQKPEQLEALPNEEKKTAISGSENLLSSDVGLQHSTRIEGLGKRARSMLGPESNVAEETLESKQNGVGDDVVDMDYEPPHRKSPIHNLSP